MKLIRLTKKIGKSTVLGKNSDMDIQWASGPGFRDGPEDYFCVKVEGDAHDFAIELSVDETRRLYDLAGVIEGSDFHFGGFVSGICNGKAGYRTGFERKPGKVQDTCSVQA